MITFEHVSKVYGKIFAVKDFSLEVPCGTTVAFLGSSGSGKTTLLRMINRMVEPTEGRVLIDGTDVASLDPVKLRRSIGYVLQNGGLFPHRTVVENISTVARLNGASRREARELSRTLLSTVGLDTAVEDRYPAELSGGQQQRVGVARALAANPSILLFDEAFGAVDPIVRRELQDELIRLKDELRKTIVFVTHDVDEALRIGDTVVVLHEQGAIAQVGTPEDILARPANDFVESFIGGNEKKLAVKEVDGARIVVDATGRPKGVLR